MPPSIYIAHTDRNWFDLLAALAGQAPLDEVNFWSPNSQRSLTKLRPGAPRFFRLGAPVRCIVGYGFEAHFALMSFEQAWTAFGSKNGFSDRLSFLEWGASKRGLSLQEILAAPLGCTILREASFWPRARWIPWGTENGYANSGNQLGKYEHDPMRVSRLLHEIEQDRFEFEEPPEFVSDFEPLEADTREIILAKEKLRRGQGTFRARLMTAYGSRCAITGEKTEPVLQAAHVQPYLGPSSNHLQNGVLLAQEVHTLFDQGLLTITPEYKVRVSPRIRERWSNGKRFYACDGNQILLPEDPAMRPSRAALEWRSRMFVA